MDPFFGGDPLIVPAAHALGIAAFVIPLLFIIITIWSLVWKAIGLWHAARNRQRLWFIALLLVNTVGILEIVYLGWFRKDNNEKGENELFPFLKKVPVPEAVKKVSAKVKIKN